MSRRRGYHAAVIRPSPLQKARALRGAASQLIFAWGSVVSALAYLILSVLGKQPLVDDHLTVTAVTMLSAYLLMRIALEAWLAFGLGSRRRSGGQG